MFVVCFVQVATGHWVMRKTIRHCCVVWLHILKTVVISFLLRRSEVEILALASPTAQQMSFPWGFMVVIVIVVALFLLVRK